jgi:minor extracellular serine protease Vpr
MKFTRLGRGPLQWVACSALLSVATFATAAPREISASGQARLDALTLPEQVEAVPAEDLVLHPSLSGLTGRHQVLVRLRTPSVSESGELTSRDQLLAEQAAFIDRALARAPSTEVIASLQLAINAVVLDVDGADLASLARDTVITRVVGVGDYRHDLSETVPYIGASAAHGVGLTGAGIRVAVIDSGVDYTHAALGGPGTQAAYEAAWAPLPAAGAPAIPTVPAGTGYLVTNDPGTTADDGLYPSAKVIGGYDFVGESWPNTAAQPDADPIAAPDATTNGGHGTHVADIIGGKLGVAPGVKIYALKACSAPATSCNGVALMQSIEWALDPNGDGNIADRVDIINMSLGSTYGQPFDDDLSAAVDHASAVGVLTVASAGNSADKPFITGSPAAATSALSVAQTSVPSATLNIMTLLAPTTGDRGAVFQPWSAPLASTIEGPVFYPAAGGKRLGCADANGANPYTPGELAGRIVIVDRGTCSFSLKIANLSAAGATLGIIGLIDASAPFAGAYGGGTSTIPGFMINLVDANVLRAGNATVRFSTTGVLSLAASLASTSSRGPRFDDSVVKPEIGAPGASISAASGSFTGTTAFGGTSGAAPMVTGAAALLKAARPSLSIGEIKQLLVNTAEKDVRQPSAAASVFPDELAPITRIGGGEVRVDRALLAPALVTDITAAPADRTYGAISFGQLDAAANVINLQRTLKVENKSHVAQHYRITPTYRYENDRDTGAVNMTVQPQSVVVPPNGSATVKVKLVVKSGYVRYNQMNAGSLGNAIGPLTANEYDGYVRFKGSNHELSIPWHILPRKSANVVRKGREAPLAFNASGDASVELWNNSQGEAQLQYFSLLGISPDIPEGERGEQSPNPDLHAVGVNTFAVGGATCGTTGTALIWEFAFKTWERKATPAGTWLEVDLDTNGDGTIDYIVLNRDVSGLTTLTDGRQVSALLRLSPTGTILSTTMRFFVENATNTNNTILRVCASDMGLTLATLGQPVTASFFASSWYFGGDADGMGPYVITPGGEEFSGSVPTIPSDVVPIETFFNLDVHQWGLFPGTTPHAGLMVVTNSDFGAANRGGATEATEAVLLMR